jgi:DNA-binding Lrp family transcriptional regulator
MTETHVLMPDGERDGAQSRAARSEMYVLVVVEPGHDRDVAALARQLPGVSEVAHVTGAYDLIVRAAARQYEDLRNLVLLPLHKLESVRRALACSVVSLRERSAA